MPSGDLSGVQGEDMKRRDFLQASGVLSANLIVGSSLLSIRKAEAESDLPIAALKAALDPKKDLVLMPGSAAPNKFDYDKSYSRRMQITPKVRVVAASAVSVGSTIRWATDNGVSFAVRSGGHSYEGFSQSADLVIDVRGMGAIALSADRKSVAIGSGASRRPSASARSQPGEQSALDHAVLDGHSCARSSGPPGKA